MQRSNKDIRTKHTVLSVLSGRTLPTLGSDLKVSALIKSHFAVPYEVTEDARKKLVAEIPDTASPEQRKERDERWRTEVMEATQDLPEIPARLLLTEKDLPQPVLDKEGKETERSAMNRQGIADLIVALGDLFAATE